MRNIDKNIEQGRKIIEKHENAGLKVSEVSVFYDRLADATEKKGFSDGVIDLISDVFLMGVAVGARNA